MESNDATRVRLLLLDDRESSRSRSVTRLAQQAGMEVVAAVADCGEAARLVQELQPDAILIEMRRLDERGLDAIAQLSALDGATRPAIVAYLEILHRGDWPDAQAAGADDLLLKEMSPRTLRGELRSIVDRVRQDGRTNPSSVPRPSEH